jgi:hypothetical protein
MDEYRPTRSEALERFRRGEIDAATYAELTRDDLVEVLTEQVTARREIEAQCKRRWRLLHRTAARPTKSSLHNGEGTRSQMTKHVGICCQAGRGVDGCEFALGRSGRVVGARRAVVAA